MDQISWPRQVASASMYPQFPFPTVEMAQQVYPTEAPSVPSNLQSDFMLPSPSLDINTATPPYIWPQANSVITVPGDPVDYRGYQPYNYMDSVPKKFDTTSHSAYQLDMQYTPKENVATPQTVMHHPAVQHPTIQHSDMQYAAKHHPAMQKPAMQPPAIQHPAIQHPAIQHPGMQKPAMQQPAMQKPDMEQPAMQKPAMKYPAIQHPAIQHPAIQHPGMQKPAMRHPAMQHSAIQHPAMQKPAMQHPAMQYPAIQHPAMQKPAMQHPAMQHPAIQHPAMQYPALQKPIMQHPAMQHPAIQYPAMQLPAIQHPAIQHPSMQKPAMQHPAMQKPAMQPPAIQCLVMQKSAMQHPAMPHPTMQQPSMQHSAIQHMDAHSTVIEHRTIQYMGAQYAATQDPSTEHAATHHPNTQQAAIQQSADNSLDSDTPLNLSMDNFKKEQNHEEGPLDLVCRRTVSQSDDDDSDEGTLDLVCRPTAESTTRNENNSYHDSDDDSFRYGGNTGESVIRRGYIFVDVVDDISNKFDTIVISDDEEVGAPAKRAHIAVGEAAFNHYGGNAAELPALGSIDYIFDQIHRAINDTDQKPFRAKAAKETYARPLRESNPYYYKNTSHAHSSGSSYGTMNTSNAGDNVHHHTQMYPSGSQTNVQLHCVVSITKKADSLNNKLNTYDLYYKYISLSKSDEANKKINTYLPSPPNFFKPSYFTQNFKLSKYIYINQKAYRLWLSKVKQKYIWLYNILLSTERRHHKRKSMTLCHVPLEPGVQARGQKEPASALANNDTFYSDV